jgi:hypothetical protein
MPDPKKKVKSTTVKGKRGATTTTTTTTLKAKKGKNLGKDFKPTKAQTAKANAAKKKVSTTTTTVRKSKGVEDVAKKNPKLSSKLAKNPERVTRAVAVARALKAKKGLSIQDRGKIALDIKKNFKK